MKAWYGEVMGKKKKPGPKPKPKPELMSKQQRFINEYLIEPLTFGWLVAFYARKLNALRFMAMHLGAMPPKRISATEEMAKENRGRLLLDDIVFAIVNVSNYDLWPWQRAACAAMLDMTVHDWRNRYPCMAGHIAKRGSVEERRWRKAVFLKDGFRCTRCESNEHLHAHHVARWAYFPEMRLVIDNGITLCRECHRKEHV